MTTIKFTSDSIINVHLWNSCSCFFPFCFHTIFLKDRMEFMCACERTPRIDYMSNLTHLLTWHGQWKSRFRFSFPKLNKKNIIYYSIKQIVRWSADPKKAAATSWRACVVLFTCLLNVFVLSSIALSVQERKKFGYKSSLSVTMSFLSDDAADVVILYGFMSSSMHWYRKKEM